MRRSIQMNKKRILPDAQIIIMCLYRSLIDFKNHRVPTAILYAGHIGIEGRCQQKMIFNKRSKLQAVGMQQKVFHTHDDKPVFISPGF